MKLSTKACLLAVSAIVPVSAFAQTPAPADDSSGIADIVVTARKTTETVRDTPVAVSVVTADKIAEQGLNSIDDFAKQSTGISFSQAFGRFTDRPVIRGASNVLANVQFGVESGAAYFVDGVYYQGDLQGFDPNSIERVEIVKGPQSALYGRNTYAGAINYITKDPSEHLSISGRGRLAEHDEVEAAGAVSGQLLNGVLGVQVGGRYYKYGGQYINQLTGKRVGQEETTSGYATIVFKPFDDFKMRTRINVQEDNDGIRAFFLQGAADNNCLPGFRSPGFRGPGTLSSTNKNQWYCGTIRPQPNNIRLNTEPLASGVQDGTAYDGIRNSQLLISNIVDWDLGGSGFVLSSLTSYRNNRNASGSDSDHSEAFVAFGPGEPLFANTSRSRQTDFSQELRLSTPTDKPLRAMVGLYYYKQKFQSQDIVFADPVARTGSVTLPLGTDNSQYAEITNRAIFGLVEWKVTPSLAITGELRYAVEKKILFDRGTASATGAYLFGAGASQGLTNLFGCTPALINRVNGAGVAIPGCRLFPEGEFSGTDPRITVNYTTPGGTLLYANYATGRKPGGFNGTAGITAQILLGRDASTYLPEKSQGFEVGMKFDALDKKLRGSVALFTNKLSNVQLSTSIPNLASGGSLTSIVTTTSDARTKGFEIELQAAPTRGLNFNMGVAYVDARFTSGCDADLFILQSGGLRPNFDTASPNAAALALCSLQGKALPLGSPWIINGSASYETDVGSGDLKLYGNTNFSFEDSKYIQTDNLAKTGDTFLLNARIGIKTDHFSISLFGRNLTNEDSIPLATRWFDLRYGSAAGRIPAGLTFDGRPAFAETGSSRAFFGALRKGRTFGVEGTFKF